MNLSFWNMHEGRQAGFQSLKNGRTLSDLVQVKYDIWNLQYTMHNTIPQISTFIFLFDTLGKMYYKIIITISVPVSIQQDSLILLETIWY